MGLTTGRAYKTTHIAAATCPRPPNLVPNLSLDIFFSSICRINKFINIYININYVIKE